MELSEVKNQGYTTENIGDIKISFLSGCVVGDELYFASWLTNGFFKINLRTGHCIPLLIFDKEKNGKFLYSQAIYFNDCIWLIPQQGENIVRINIITLEIKYMLLPHSRNIPKEKEKNLSWKFRCCYKSGESVFWLVPISYDMMFKVDMMTCQIIEIEDNHNIFTYKEGCWNFVDACFSGNEIWLCPYDYNDLVIYDTINMQFRIHKWNYERRNFGFIRNYKGWNVFISKEAKEYILLVNVDTYEEKKINLNVNWAEKKSLMYMVADVVDQFIILAPFLAHEYIVIDLETGRIQVDTSMHDFLCAKGWESERFQSSFRCRSKMIYSSDIEGMPLMLYDLCEKTVSYMNIGLDYGTYNKFIEKMYKESDGRVIDLFSLAIKDKDAVLEKELPLFLYLMDIDKIGKNAKIRNLDGNKTVGEEIFTYIKKSKQTII